MKLSVSVILLALGVSVAAECLIMGSGHGTVGDRGCCWGGNTGRDACFRQTGSNSCNRRGTEQNKNFCINRGVTKERCNADCCDIETGRGQPCPRGDNRCDADSGCPYRTYPGGKLI